MQAAEEGDGGEGNGEQGGGKDQSLAALAGFHGDEDGEGRGGGAAGDMAGDHERGPELPEGAGRERRSGVRPIGTGQGAGRKPCFSKTARAAGVARKAMNSRAAVFWREALGMAQG